MLNCCCYQCSPIVEAAVKQKNFFYYGTTTRESKQFENMYRENRLNGGTMIDPSHVFEIYVPMMDENVFGGLPNLFDKETYPLTFMGLPRHVVPLEQHVQNGTDGDEKQADCVKFVFNEEAYTTALIDSDRGGSEHRDLNVEEQKELLRCIIHANIEQHEWRYCISNINSGISHSFPCPGKMGSALLLSPFTCGLSMLPILLLRNHYVSEAMRRIDLYLGKVNKKLYDRAIEKQFDYYLQFQVVRKEIVGISWVQANIISTKCKPTIRNNRFVETKTIEDNHRMHSRELRDEDYSDEELQDVELSNNL